eukprot:g12953.t1
MSRAAEVYKQKKLIREQLAGRTGAEGGVTVSKKAKEQVKVGSEDLPVTANERFNFSATLHFAVTRSKYFKSLQTIVSFEDLVEELIDNVKHGGLFQNVSRTEPSKFACLVHRLFVMNISIEKAKFLLNQYDSPYIRLAGALYLRMGLDFSDLWEWLEPVLADYEVLYIDCEAKKQVSLGSVVEEMLTSNLYDSMHLPRIPMNTMKKFASMISGENDKEGYSEVRERAKRNEPIRDLHVVGSKVDARYSKDGLFYSGTIVELCDYDQVLVAFDDTKIREKRGLGFIELRLSGKDINARTSDREEYTFGVDRKRSPPSSNLENDNRGRKRHRKF